MLRKKVISVWQLSYDERIKLVSFILYSLGKKGKRVKTIQRLIEKNLSLEVPLKSLIYVLSRLKQLGIAWKVSKSRWRVKESLSEEDLLKLFQLSIIREEKVLQQLYLYWINWVMMSFL